MAQLLQSALNITKKGNTIYMAKENWSLRIPEMLNFCYKYKDVFASFVGLRNDPSEVFLVNIFLRILQ